MKNIYSLIGLIILILVITKPACGNFVKVCETRMDSIASAAQNTQTDCFDLTKSDKTLLITNPHFLSYNCKIYNQDGQLVFILNSVNVVETIDIKSFINGKYFYFISNGKGQHLAGNFNVNNPQSFAVY